MSSRPDSPRDEPPRWTFFRQWLRNPLAIAAISPSSRQLARLMTAELPEGARRVVELGAGTGVFTTALLDQGIAPADLLVVELNEALHQHLRQRFPGVWMACADAGTLAQVAQRTGYLEGGPVDAVVSGLGLLSMGRATQKRILSSAFKVMRPGGHFIQFTYGPAQPVSSEVAEELGLVAQRRGMALWNIPPATVWVYTRPGEPASD